MTRGAFYFYLGFAGVCLGAMIAGVGEWLPGGIIMFFGAYFIVNGFKKSGDSEA